MIFVSIASYRDKELIKTVKSCLSKAKYPSNIKIGICWQYDEEEDINIFDSNSQIDIEKIYWKDVKSSTNWARSLIQQKLFNNEDFYLQIDSHTMFVQDWDEIFIDMYSKLPTDKAVISVGPPYYYDLSGEGALNFLDYEPVELRDGIYCDKFVKKQKLEAVSPGGIMYGFLPATEEELETPMLARHISAALLFTTNKWVEDTPYDPEMYFSVEEPSITFRTFTNGYDIFNPNKFALFHLKYRFEERKRHWNTFPPEAVDKVSEIANKKYRKLMNGEDLGKFGMGKKRSILDWEIYSGVSLKDGIAHQNAWNGVIPNPITITDLEEWEKMKKTAQNGI